MKKLLALLLVTALLVMSFPIMSVVAAETDAEGYTLIKTADDFVNIKNNPSGTYKLVSNITLPDDYVPFEFSGILLGDDENALKSITVNIGAEDSINNWGLFSVVSGAFQIKNITLKGSVTGANGDGKASWGYAGGFAGVTSNLLEGAIIENCVNEATITNAGTTPEGTGGFIGKDLNKTHYLTLKNLTNKGAVTSTALNNGGIAGTFSGNALYCSNIAAINGNTGRGSGGSGGLFGNLEGAVVNQCFNTGNVFDSNASGGIAGIINYEGGSGNNSTTIINCYNTGSVSARNLATCGILGAANKSGNAVSIENCYTAVVPQTRPVAYIAGSSLDAPVVNTYYLRASASADVDGSSHLTEAQFTNLSNFTGFSSDVWEIDSLSDYKYPQLKNNRQAYPKYTEITTEEGFKAIANDTAGLYKLMSDIELTGDYTITSFSGLFDGNGYTITVKDGTAPLIDSLSGTLKNLTVEGNVTLSTIEKGVFVGTNTGVVDGCINKASVIFDASYTGAIVGYNPSGTIINCENHGNITITKSTAGHGGIVGVSRSGITIENCANYGEIVSSSGAHTIGGMVGELRVNTVTAFKNCLNAGNISVNDTRVGGIFPAFLHATYVNLKFDNCYNSGIITVAGTDYTTEKGIYDNNSVGATGAVFENCYCLISGSTAAKTGTTGLTAEQMQNKDNFAGFDFDKVWKMPSADNAYKYPQHIASSYVVEIVKGTEENPYLIPADISFAEIDSKEGVYYKLSEDIELSGDYSVAEFAGNFDGNGKTITITDGTTALFDVLSATAVVENFNVEGNVSAAAVVARYSAGTINNVKNYASLTVTKSMSGVFAGEMAGGSLIKNCGNYADITTSSNISSLGGIAGYVYYGTIENCVNTGNIISKADADDIGGIVGQLRTKDTVAIKNCMNTGTLSASKKIGGIIGSIPNVAYVNVTIENSYNVGKVIIGGEDYTNANAIYAETLGENTVTSTCYYLTSGATEGKAGNGKTSDELKAQSTFAGWNFDTTWLMPGADKAYKYPQLIGLTFDVEAGLSKDYPIEIATADAFKAISSETTKGYYKLTDNITLTGDYAISSFSGNLDGNRKTITINNGTTAIFAELTATAEVYNLTIEGNVTNSGAILTNLNYGIISDCVNNASLVTGAAYSGVFAANNCGKIDSCVNNADLKFSASGCGGIAGENNGTIINCGNNGNIKQHSGAGGTGGIAGQHGAGNVITNCYNTGTIEGGTQIGGIIGTLFRDNSSVADCYNAGNVIASGGKFAGGIIGGIGHSGRGEANPYTGIAITNCYNSGAIMCTTTNNTAEWAIYGEIINKSANPEVSGCAYLAAETTEAGNVQGLVRAEFDVKVADYNITMCDSSAILAPTNYKAYENNLFVFSADKYLTTEQQFKVLGKNTLLSFANANFGKMGWALDNVGFIVSKTNSNPTVDGDDCKVIEIGKANALGDFSILAYGDYITEGGYYIKPYAKYTRVGEDTVTVYGDVTSVQTYVAKP